MTRRSAGTDLSNKPTTTRRLQTAWQPVLTACGHLRSVPYRHLGPSEVVSGCSLSRFPALRGTEGSLGDRPCGSPRGRERTDRGAGRASTTRSGSWRRGSRRRRGTAPGRRLDDEMPPRDSGGTTKAAAGTLDASVPYKHLGPPQVAKTAQRPMGSSLRGTKVPLGDRPCQGSGGGWAATGCPARSWTGGPAPGGHAKGRDPFLGSRPC